jgi:hypothetical protein
VPDRRRTQGDDNVERQLHGGSLLVVSTRGTQVVIETMTLLPGASRP